MKKDVKKLTEGVDKMMQEHPQHIKRASTLRGNSWTTPAHILKML